MAFTAKARQDWEFRVARIADPREFEKAQKMAMQAVVNRVRKRYVSLWRGASFKRAAGGGHREAIRQSIRAFVTSDKRGIVIGRVGTKWTGEGRAKAAIVNVIDPGFRPHRAKRSVPGYRVRDRSQAYAASIAAVEFRGNLVDAMQARANGQTLAQYRRVTTGDRS